MDFYGRLEEQLVSAGRRRSAGGRVRRAATGRRPQLLAATAIVAVVIVAATILPAVLRSSPSGPAMPTRDSAPAPRVASLKGIRVSVYNGTTTPGVARDMALRLERRGAKIDLVADTGRRHNLTEVRAEGGTTDTARRVSAAIGIDGVVLKPKLPPGEVEIVIGTDFARRPTAANMRVTTRINNGPHEPVQVSAAAIRIGIHRASCALEPNVGWQCIGRKDGVKWRCQELNQRPAPYNDFELRCGPGPQRPAP